MMHAVNIAGGDFDSLFQLFLDSRDLEQDPELPGDSLPNQGHTADMIPDSSMPF